MIAGEAFRGRSVRETIAGLGSDIDAAGGRYGVDSNAIRAIIYEEQTHLTPFEAALERRGYGSTVGLGQVTVGYYGYTRQQLLDPRTNVQAVARHLSSFQGLPNLPGGGAIPSLATRYNCGSCTAVTAYGRRVTEYYSRFVSGGWPGPDF
jgi:soluble lytic murein transglycosylase-like protein